jgi:hypothetical protein
MLAKHQLRSPARHAAAGEEETSSPAALARTSWQKCLHDTQSSLYYNSASDTLYVVLLKCEALQALDKHEEAVEEVIKCLTHLHMWLCMIYVLVFHRIVAFVTKLINLSLSLSSSLGLL